MFTTTYILHKENRSFLRLFNFVRNIERDYNKYNDKYAVYYSLFVHIVEICNNYEKLRKTIVKNKNLDLRFFTIIEYIINDAIDIINDKNKLLVLKVLSTMQSNINLNSSTVERITRIIESQK
jgi:hypothetical protein